MSEESHCDRAAYGAFASRQIVPVSIHGGVTAKFSHVAMGNMHKMFLFNSIPEAFVNNDHVLLLICMRWSKSYQRKMERNLKIPPKRSTSTWRSL